VLCATGRLSQTLREQYDRTCVTRGMTEWDSLVCKTVDQWLDELWEEAALKGLSSLDDTDVVPLDAFGERLIWEQAILETLEGDDKFLLDVTSLVRTASQAYDLQVIWSVNGGRGPKTKEAAQFDLWRTRFLEICKKLGYVDRASLKKTLFLNWRVFLREVWICLHGCILLASTDTVRSTSNCRLRSVDLE